MLRTSRKKNKRKLKVERKRKEKEIINIFWFLIVPLWRKFLLRWEEKERKTLWPSVDYCFTSRDPEMRLFTRADIRQIFADIWFSFPFSLWPAFKTEDKVVSASTPKQFCRQKFKYEKGIFRRLQRAEVILAFIGNFDHNNFKYSQVEIKQN